MIDIAAASILARDLTREQFSDRVRPDRPVRVPRGLVRRRRAERDAT